MYSLTSYLIRVINNNQEKPTILWSSCPIVMGLGMEMLCLGPRRKRMCSSHEESGVLWESECCSLNTPQPLEITGDSWGADLIGYGRSHAHGLQLQSCGSCVLVLEQQWLSTGSVMVPGWCLDTLLLSQCGGCSWHLEGRGQGFGPNIPQCPAQLPQQRMIQLQTYSQKVGKAAPGHVDVILW